MEPGTRAELTHALPHAPRTPRQFVPKGPASVHAYARRASGLHGIALDEAISLIKQTKTAGSSEALVWIDIVCPGEPEEHLLRERLGFHPLAVEDCLRGRQRPKLDRYPGYLFLVAYAAWVNPERDRTALDELHVFVGDRWIVTVHEHKLRLVSEVIARWRAQEAAYPTSGSLAHALLDLVVDGYLAVIDHLGVHVDEIEHRILSDSDKNDHMPRLLELRHEVATVRRMLSPLHDIIRLLMRRDPGVLDDNLMPYFQDILDHVKRETEELDAMRDTLAATLDAYLSISANKLNHTVRIMAAWSIIFMAMAWIAGIYGMNFDAMPELEWRYGYLWALVLMLSAGIGLMALFRRRGWI